LVDARKTYSQHEVLLIGSNGFLGKVLLGLLLDRFADFKHLHLLLRPRRNVSPQERFRKEILGSPAIVPILERLGDRAPLDKITVHAGDLGQPNCGLDEETLEKLAGRVDLVINCAGLVEFFPPVDDSFLSNVDGVERVCALCRRLEAKLVHVSTCFVCGEADGFVEESEPILGFYPRRKGPRDQGFQHDREVHYMRERIREAYETEGLERGARRPAELSQKLSDLGWQRAAQWGWVNTYTYSKSLGEQIIASRDDLDCTIVRPAIVEAALDFPFPGWVEGGRTAAPLVMMAMSGLRYWTVREDAPMEVVPVDLVAAAILIAGVMLLNDCAEPVYHVSTADVNPIYFGPLIRILYREYLRQRRSGKNGNPSLGAFTIPLGVRSLTPERARVRGRRYQKSINQLQQWTTNLRRTMQRSGVPGWRHLRRVATLLRVTGLQIMIRDQALDLYRPFMYDNRFIFEAENIRRAYRALPETDRELLPWTPEKIDWADYWVNSEVAGVEKWVRKEGSFRV